MKKLLPLFAVFFLFCSCSSYQYLTLDASNAVKDTQKNLVWENDTVKLVYRFVNNGTLAFTAYNKTREPLYINWGRSAIIINNKSTVLADNKIEINGKLSADPVLIKTSAATATLKASGNIPDAVSFMPPQTQVEKSGIIITGIANELPRLNNTVPAQRMKDKDGLKIDYRQASYNAGNSPLKLRIYLMMGIGTDNKAFAVEQLLYVSEIIESGNGLHTYFIKETEGDKFYVRLPSM